MLVDPVWVLLELLVGGVGFVLFTYGRKQERIPYFVVGVLFMVYPLFVANAGWLILDGVCLGGVLWCAVRLGW